MQQKLFKTVEVECQAFYLGHGGLQDYVADGQGGCIQHGHHYHQNIGPARGTVGSKVEKNPDAVFIVRRHRAHFAFVTTGNRERETQRETQREREREKERERERERESTNCPSTKLYIKSSVILVISHSLTLPFL